MNAPARRLIAAFGEFLILLILTLLVPAAVWFDLVVLGHGVPETSVTERTQEGMLLISAVLFAMMARRDPQARGFLILVAGFFLAMLMREWDGMFDAVAKWFWRVPALAVAAVACTLAWFNRTTILQPMADFAGTRAFHHMVVGFLILFVFSRTFGSGALLWKDILGAEYDFVFKSALQEGLELFGYVFIFYGSWLNYWTRGRTPWPDRG